MKTKMKSFVKEVLAQLKGDTDTVVAERNYRMANSGVKGQLAALEAKKVKAEVTVSKAEDALKVAKYPVTEIEDGEVYIRNIYKAEEAVKKAKKELKAITDSEDYAKKLDKEFNKD